MDPESRPVVDYGIDTAEDDATISLRDNVWNNEITVYGTNGEIGTYELEHKFGPRALDTLSSGGFMEDVKEVGEYTLSDILVQTVGEQNTEDILSTLEVSDAEIEEVKRDTARENQPQTYQVVESFYVPIEEGQDLGTSEPSNDGPMFDDIEPRDESLPDPEDL